MESLLNQVLEGDGIAGLSHIPDQSIHLILSDIPYGISAETWDVLHANTNSALLGSSPAQRRAGAVFKARGKPINGWSDADRAIPRQYYEWCSSWAGEWRRVLKPGGSVMVFAGRRMAHRCVCALEDAGLSFRDMLGWKRARAPHRAQRVSQVFERRGDAENAALWEGWRLGNLRPILEPILWFVGPYRVGGTVTDTLIDHQVGAYHEAAFLNYEASPDNLITGTFAPGEAGYHPTQKPVRTLQTLIELVTRPGQIVLDPFCGSGSTLVAAQSLDRRFIGFESDPRYCQIARERLASPYPPASR